jgi:hypothetical protein
MYRIFKCGNTHSLPRNFWLFILKTSLASKWWMGSGGWRVVDGEWWMESGGWRVVDGEWRMGSRTWEGGVQRERSGPLESSFIEYLPF